MRILLVYPDVFPSIHAYKGYFNQGVASIAAVLQKAGHDVKLLHLITPPRYDWFANVLVEYNPQVVGVSSTTNQFELARLTAGWARGLLPGAVIVSGGIHSTLNADQIVNLEEFDMVCRGEGELPMLHLVEKLEQGGDWEDTPGMWFRGKDRTIRRNRSLPPIENLDDLPWPSRSVWNYPTLQMESLGFACVKFSRGCPNRCTYCCNLAISRIFREDGGGRYFRIRSVDSAISELVWIRQKYPFIKAFNFDDDNLFMDIQWAREFSQRYAQEVARPFTCNLYPGIINRERVELLKSAGCIDLRIGLESGNEEIRNNLLGRKISNDMIREAYRLCRCAGIRTRSFVMVGLPDETPEMVLDTLQFVADEQVGIAQCSIFIPYRGTELYDYTVARGYIEEKGATSADFFTESILDMDTMQKKQIRMFRNYFPVFVLMFRAVNLLPGVIRAAMKSLLRNVLKARWMPNLLNPISGSLRIAKKILPRNMNLVRIRMDRKKG